MSAASDDLRGRMAAVAEAIESELERLLPPVAGATARLAEAMRYATLGGGKRLRPFLTVAASELFEVDPAAAVRVGVAIEMVHGYSLIHDDLPAMDDAELRRGRPCCHRQFDEATAILAGDALQALAFEVLAAPAVHLEPAVRIELVQGLAAAAGAAGMCGGQMIDLEAEGRALTSAEVEELERLKTGALIGFACEAGAILGQAPEDARRALRTFAGALGLAFQIRDDLLDVEGDVATTGKDQGIDAASGKATLVGLLGIAGARARLGELHVRAIQALEPFGSKSGVLRAVMEFVIHRSS
ncbi:MAG: polyprenyl synthetase family protein [Geminicoccaceae bacterium]|nr:polyprenyl synthetase family protein [Geminicoccaceae bacterium]